MSNKKNKNVKDIEEVTKDKKEVVKKKKKMTTAQKNKIIMQIAAWALAIIMILGVIASFLAYLI